MVASLLHSTAFAAPFCRRRNLLDEDESGAGDADTRLTPGAGSQLGSEIFRVQRHERRCAKERVCSLRHSDPEPVSWPLQRLPRVKWTVQQTVSRVTAGPDALSATSAAITGFSSHQFSPDSRLQITRSVGDRGMGRHGREDGGLRVAILSFAAAAVQSRSCAQADDGMDCRAFSAFLVGRRT